MAYNLSRRQFAAALAAAGLAACLASCVHRPVEAKSRHIVFVIGDDEYRSEDSMPQLAKILSVHHGFKCTLLFAINKETGEIDPRTLDNIPGLEALNTADLMVLFTRFRELPDDQMKHIIGRQVLGETWISHYGGHQKESTRGLVAKGMENHPIVKGIEDIWGPSDVYGITTLSGDSEPLIMGQVLLGMDPNDKPNPDKKPVPVAWTKTYTGQRGKAARVFTTTMGHGGDLKSEGFRRLLVNACYWCMGMEDKIPAKSKVDIVGDYEPNPIGIDGHKKGLKPSTY
ncbi:MAG: ThuA domain-containing protein [Planctomycetota bacterium]|jgi:hypothetical protein